MMRGGLKLYIAAAGSGHNWPGATIMQITSQNEYIPLSEVNNPSVIGTVVEALQKAESTCLDHHNNITVSLISGELESVSFERLLNGANLAIIGDEIIQFSHATLISDYCYRLSGLLRGRLGTEHKISTHQPLERFVLLSAALTKISMPLSIIGSTCNYVAMTGETESKKLRFTYQALGVKPYSPVHLKVIKGSDCWQVSWVRRSRIFTSWSVTEVPLGEVFEKYEVDLLLKNQLVKTIVATDTKCQVELTTGFDQVRVYQISDLVGRGEGVIATLYN